MNIQQKNKENGFTIIEVVLVLAIAGLIFLMVFIALPALQRGQRDTQRRDDVSRFMSQLNSYATNNRGSIPSDNSKLSSFKTSYLKLNEGEFNDPSTGNAYDVIFNNSSGAVPLTMGQMQYAYNRECAGEDIGTSSPGSRQAAVRVQLESGGYFCQSLQ